MTWNQFENELYKLLKDRVTSTEEPAASRVQDFTVLAKKITDLYHTTAISAKETSQRNIFAPAALEPGKTAIQSAIFASLNMMYNLNLKASVATLMPIGLAVSTYWVPAISPGIINTLPPQLPAVAPSPGSIVTFTGNLVLVAQGFKKAYTSYDNETDFNVSLRKSAGDIRKGFENHMKTIAGTYVGTTPVPAPVVIPWVGLIPV